MYITQYYSLNSSHLPLRPLCPEVHPLCLGLYALQRFNSTIFLDSVYLHQYTIFVFLFLTYCTPYNRLSVYPHHKKWPFFIPSYDWKTFQYIYMYHIFFTHSSVDGHLGCLYVLSIVNSTAMNTGLHVSFWIMALNIFFVWHDVMVL